MNLISNVFSQVFFFSCSTSFFLIVNDPKIIICSRYIKQQTAWIFFLFKGFVRHFTESSFSLCLSKYFIYPWNRSCHAIYTYTITASHAWHMKSNEWKSEKQWNVLSISETWFIHRIFCFFECFFPLQLSSKRFRRFFFSSKEKNRMKQ